MEISHADDTIIFCPNQEGMLSNWWMVINIFLLDSSLSLNLKKTALIGINVEEEILRSTYSVYGCRVEEFPFSYLGIPLGGNHKSLLFWEPVVDKVRKKIDEWRNFVDLLDCLSIFVPTEEEDVRRWTLESLGLFSVSSLCKINDVPSPKDYCAFLWKLAFRESNKS